METQIQRPQQRKNVHQDEQNHGGHDKCHLQLVITHPARCLVWVVGKHIYFETYESDIGWKGGRIWREGWKGGRIG